MINLTYQGNTASVILRLRQVCQLTSPYYLFGLENKNTKVVTYITADDISLGVGLYQEFNWRNGILGLTQGNFIADIGEYLVTIYETQYQYNLNPASASDILMYDTLRIIGSASPTQVGYTQSDIQHFAYFGNGN